MVTKGLFNLNLDVEMSIKGLFYFDLAVEMSIKGIFYFDHVVACKKSKFGIRL